MDCDYIEFLLCDLCPKVKTCNSKARVVSTNYIIYEYIRNDIECIRKLTKKSAIDKLNNKYGLGEDNYK